MVYGILLIVAVCTVLIAYPWSVHDDSQFVNGFLALENKTISDVIDHLESHDREFEFQESVPGGLLGLNVYSFDGHLIAITIKPIHAMNRPANGWQIDQLLDLPIRSINIHDLLSERMHSESRFR